jgi:hypothetical protein
MLKAEITTFWNCISLQIKKKKFIEKKQTIANNKEYININIR